jgi:hypothetical protein
MNNFKDVPPGAMFNEDGMTEEEVAERKLLESFAFVGDEPPSPQPMLIDGVLPLECLPFIGGQSSAGKTFIAILMAVCAATQTPFFGRAIRERVGVVFLAAEGRAALRMRFAAALKELHLGEDLPIAWLKGTPDFSNRNAVAAFVAKLQGISEYFQKKFRVRLGLVFVDTVSASFDLEEEADNAEASRVCKIMRRISEQVATIVVPIHHYGKNAAVGLRGASAWRGSADVVLSVTADIDPTTGRIGNRQLSLAKERDGEQGPLTAFTLKRVELGIDDDGKPFGSMVAVAEGEAAKTTSPWPPSLSVFKQALTEALIADGKDEQPFPNCPVVKTVDVEMVKGIFATLTHTDSDTEEGRKEAIRKQFTRRLNDAQQRHLIGVKSEPSGRSRTWLIRRTDTDTVLGAGNVSGNGREKDQ